MSLLETLKHTLSDYEDHLRFEDENHEVRISITKWLKDFKGLSTIIQNEWNGRYVTQAQGGPYFLVPKTRQATQPTKPKPVVRPGARVPKITIADFSKAEREDLRGLIEQIQYLLDKVKEEIEK